MWAETVFLGPHRLRIVRTGQIFVSVDPGRDSGAESEDAIEEHGMVGLIVIVSRVGVRATENLCIVHWPGETDDVGACHVGVGTLDTTGELLGDKDGEVVPLVWTVVL